MAMTDTPEKTPQPPDGPVPKAVVNRLSLYLRELQQLVRNGTANTSSNQLGSMLGLTDAQVRKDLAYFGHFGYPGIGYKCQELISAIRKILGTDRGWPVALIGTGNLGRALLGYKGFESQNFQIVAAFDVAEEVVGTRIEGIPVHHLNDLAQVVKSEQIKLGMIMVPSHAAQGVADQLIQAGIVGILNFAPVTLVLPDHVKVVGVDLAIELEQLCFNVAQHKATTSDHEGKH
jgi:redox-sensing transcriptional repressor